LAINAASGFAGDLVNLGLNVAGTFASRFKVSSAGDVTINAANIITDTTTGMKIGTGATQKLGFWNATPVVQQDTGVTSATFDLLIGGTFVKDVSTFDGYTISQVVKALRTYGLLA
jgi:hypothetical protein